MPGNWHVRCGAGEKLEIASKAYLLLTIVKLRIDFLIIKHLGEACLRDNFFLSCGLRGDAGRLDC
jgi:hypothetical protein